MAIAAKDIIHRSVDTLQDTTSIRWPISELVRYLNDGQREVVLYRPDAMITNAALDCEAGSKQTLPTGGAKLIDVVRNTVSKRAVRLTNREILDSQMPGWHGYTPVADALHYMFDPRDPKVFYVYPPLLTTASLDIVFAAYPANIIEPGEGASHDDVGGNISLPDIYGNILNDYVLYRAYTKDSEYAGNGQRAQNHYAAFANALGIEIKATVAVAPTSQNNPNIAQQRGQAQ
jgi:hypothetical protein